MDQLTKHPIWTTVLGIQERTGGIALPLIYGKLREAENKGESWVKREGPGNRARFLVNINSLEYHTIEEGWLTNERQTEEIAQVQIAPVDPQHPADPRTEYLAQWARFGAWLADHELIVYRNVIERNPEWSWSWGDTGFTGYEDKTDAMIAALKYHLCYGEPLTGYQWKRQMSAFFSALRLFLGWLFAQVLYGLFWIYTRALLLWNWFRSGETQ
jgi:hypothetical protein